MKIFAPEYYNDFKCIADKCNHSCCVGWDIEIDSATLDTYFKIDGMLGEKLRGNIAYKDGAACFELDKRKRCPFLRENGLCEIILVAGEEFLCDICSDHPRFRNYFSDRVETGLGLCCEEVSRLALTTDYGFDLCCVGVDFDEEFPLDDVEKYILTMRDKFSDVLKSSENNYSECKFLISRILERDFPAFTSRDVGEIYLQLEMLEKSWGNMVEEFSRISCNMLENCEKYSFYSKRLLNYFLFRHFSNAVSDGRIYERTVFAFLSTEIIISMADIFSKNKFDAELLCDIARRYSSEIEYSDENIDKILDFITKKSLD